MPKFLLDLFLDSQTYLQTSCQTFRQTSPQTFLRPLAQTCYCSLRWSAGIREYKNICPSWRPSASIRIIEYERVSRFPQSSDPCCGIILSTHTLRRTSPLDCDSPVPCLSAALNPDGDPSSESRISEGFGRLRPLRSYQRSRLQDC